MWLQGGYSWTPDAWIECTRIYQTSREATSFIEICMQQEPRSLLHEDVEGVWPKIQLISKIQTLPYLDKFGRGCQQEGFAFAKFCCATQGELMYRNLKQYILPKTSDGSSKWLVCKNHGSLFLTHTIHSMVYLPLFTYIYHKNQPNVYIYSIYIYFYKDPTGVAHSFGFHASFSDLYLERLH